MAGSVREEAATDVVVEWSRMLRKWVVSKHGIHVGEFTFRAGERLVLLNTFLPLTKSDLQRIADLMDSTPEVPEGH